MVQEDEWTREDHLPRLQPVQKQNSKDKKKIS